MTFTGAIVMNIDVNNNKDFILYNTFPSKVECSADIIYYKIK